MTNFIEIEKGWNTSNVGSVVEFSPATREARVRFPDVAMLLIYFVVGDILWVGKILKNHKDLERRFFLIFIIIDSFW